MREEVRKKKKYFLSLLTIHYKHHHLRPESRSPTTQSNLSASSHPPSPRLTPGTISTLRVISLTSPPSISDHRTTTLSRRHTTTIHPPFPPIPHTICPNNPLVFHPSLRSFISINIITPLISQQHPDFMGAGEGNSTAKPVKPNSTQETHPPSYADWSTSMQAYYGGGAPPPFFPSIVASPGPHPYIWGGQHPMMPPYGAPVPYPTLYSPAEVYAHPGTPVVARQKVASSSGNDGNTTQSAESENDGSSDANLQKNPIVHMPATAGNLNGGIDSSNPSAGNVALEMQSNPPGAPQTVVPSPVMGQWARPDERELKRQKRKQSNRESARRSRMRKQAECEELQARVETLNKENQGLKEELQRLSEECKKLTSENDSMKGKLSKFSEPEGVLKRDAPLKSQADAGNN